MVKTNNPTQNISDIWQEPKNKNKIFFTPITKCWAGKDGIGRIIFLPQAAITLETAKKHFAVCTKLARGKKESILVDLRNIKSANYEGRQYFASEAASKITKASAVIVSSPVSKMIGNFFIGLNKPPFPTKIFTSELKAMRWLKNLK